MYKILLVDDDPVILESNQVFFRSHGYEVICAKTAETAEEIILSNSIDCVILDVDLPGENGFGLCEKIRMKTGIPIVFLSGYTEEENRIRGLTVGGDDYICKPYSLTELELRVRARIRSGRVAKPPKPLVYGPFSVHPSTCSASFGTRSTDFSSYEFDVLYFLARQPGEIFTPEQIYDSVWKAPMNKGQKSLAGHYGAYSPETLRVMPRPRLHPDQTVQRLPFCPLRHKKAGCADKRRQKHETKHNAVISALLCCRVPDIAFC